MPGSPPSRQVCRAEEPEPEPGGAASAGGGRIRPAGPHLRPPHAVPGCVSAGSAQPCTQWAGQKWHAALGMHVRGCPPLQPPRVRALCPRTPRRGPRPAGPPERGHPPVAPVLSLAPPHLALCAAAGGGGRHSRVHATYVAFGNRGDKVGRPARLGALTRPSTGAQLRFAVAGRMTPPGGSCLQCQLIHGIARPRGTFCERLPALPVPCHVPPRWWPPTTETTPTALTQPEPPRQLRRPRAPSPRRSSVLAAGPRRPSTCLHTPPPWQRWSSAS